MLSFLIQEYSQLIVKKKFTNLKLIPLTGVLDVEDKLRSLLHGVLRKRDRDRDICKKIFEENIYRAIVEGQYVKDNLLNDKI